MKEIKPYYFYRCGILHKRVQLDYGIRLTEEEIEELKEALGRDEHKQRALQKEWVYLTGICKKVPGDGVDMVGEKLRECMGNKK